MQPVWEISGGFLEKCMGRVQESLGTFFPETLSFAMLCLCSALCAACVGDLWRVSGEVYGKSSRVCALFLEATLNPIETLFPFLYCFLEHLTTKEKRPTKNRAGRSCRSSVVDGPTVLKKRPLYMVGRSVGRSVFYSFTGSCCVRYPMMVYCLGAGGRSWSVFGRSSVFLSYE